MQGETPQQIAGRMRLIAASMSNKDDAAEITRYADWLQRQSIDRTVDDPTTLLLWPLNRTRK